MADEAARHLEEGERRLLAARLVVVARASVLVAVGAPRDRELVAIDGDHELGVDDG